MTELTALCEKIRQADAILIGASNGLSITEGLHLFANNRHARCIRGLAAEIRFAEHSARHDGPLTFRGGTVGFLGTAD